MCSHSLKARDQSNDSPIAIEGLRKAFGEQKVLDGINLEVVKGETVAVLGRSGGGKSVLLKLLIGLQTPDSGSIRIAGQEITKLNEKQLNDVRKKIGFLFQQAALYDSLTVEENVAFPHRIAGESARVARDRAVALLERVGLADRRAHMSRSLSGGEQQRVAIARALARSPSLLLADEPTGNLDAESARTVFDLLAELHRERGMTTVLVTHNPDLAKRCDKIFNMSREAILPATGFSG